MVVLARLEIDGVKVWKIFELLQSARFVKIFGWSNFETKIIERRKWK